MIPDPDNIQLGQLYRYSGLASVASYQYDQYRDKCSYVMVCSHYTAAEIFEKLNKYTTKESEADEHRMVMIIALLSALSFKKRSELDYVNELVQESSGHWLMAIKKCVFKDSVDN